MAADTPAGRSGVDSDGDADREPPGSDPGGGPGTTAADRPSHPAFAAYAEESIPQAPVGAPGKDGRLELRFVAAGAEPHGPDDEPGATRLVRDHATVPFHVSGTLGHDPHSRAETVHVQSPTGGIAQGDRLDVTVTVGPGAVAAVSTGSATKVQSMNRNYAAERTRLSVGPGAHLDYVPQPTILHADARFRRETTLAVAPGGSAVLSSVVVPGRLARGERFAFDRYLARTRGRRRPASADGVTGAAESTDGADSPDESSADGSNGDRSSPDGSSANGDTGRLLFADATHMAPDETDPTAPGVLGEYPVQGAAFVVAPDEDAGALADRLHEATTDGTADEEAPAEAGASALPNGAGVAVRALGDTAEAVADRLHAARDVARRELIGAPAPRRRH